jgi:hypothetical protein
MARWASAVPSFTTAATADATNLADTTHTSIQGGSATQRGELREVYIGGLAGSSAPSIMLLGRDSQVGTGALTGGRLAALDPSTAALAAPPLTFTSAATNKPQRSTTLGALLNLSLNAFGGIVRWYMGPDEVISYLGNTASLGELSLSAFTGSTAALIGTNIVFETI